MTKNENFGINLLMEHQFKKILQKTKAQKEQKDPLFKTFEGALFENSSWFFHFQDHAFPIEETSNQPQVEKKLQVAATGLSPLMEVLFVGDTYNGEGDDLLGKMIIAMKLENEDFYRHQMDEELESITDLVANLESPSRATQDILKLIEEKRPKIVVTLGATITNILLGKREKLSSIHGQFFEKQEGACFYSLMPIFHPDFLQINPNMKRTAWIDLQKVMERIGKI